MTACHSEQKTTDLGVLLVDDEVDFLGTLAKRLDRRGFTVFRASSGPAGLDLLQQQPIDVVVMDVKMPEMDGIETLRHVKQDHCDVEVILLTGNASTADGVEGIKQGAFDYITKPVDIDHLAGKIRQAGDKRRRAEERQREQEQRKQLEQQMMATERLASLGTLSTGVAHEINNPLAMMQEAAGYMRLILEKDEKTVASRRVDLGRALEKIEKGVDRIRRITHLLLGFVRKSGQAYSETDIQALMEETLELMVNEMRDKDIRIQRQMTEDAGIIVSDPYALRQVLINLVTNAAHAIKNEGAITLGLARQQHHVEITVSDTGEGIPKEIVNRIFEPFFSTKPPDKGTGLGLFVTRGIVNRLGGEISVNSAVGHGTTFTVRLPVCPPADDLSTGDADQCDAILQKIKEATDDDKNTGQGADR
ncbi:MAG: response regulator [Thermodesulfobacteriota bacterium]|nr:response regulator [Thermodesulfobacteriota bacterium]